MLGIFDFWNGKVLMLSIGFPENQEDKEAIFMIKNFLRDENRSLYFDVLEEVRLNLEKGEIVLGNRVCKENRLTTLYSSQNFNMTYSGRSLEPKKPEKGGQIEFLLEIMNSQELKTILSSEVKNIDVDILDFNAVFVNWYRPIAETENNKMDGLGWHSDDYRTVKNDVIISLTFCEENGERDFQIRKVGQSSGCVWEHLLSHGSLLVMLPGCQKAYKHRISDRKTRRLTKTKITGGRLNLTFRCL